MEQHDKAMITYNADVVVIGGGGCGLTAAVTAAEKGASVVVIEKRAVGGNTAMAQGFFVSESPIQKSLNRNVSNDEAFHVAMEYSHWRVNPKLLRAFINRSAETHRWLAEKGLKFDKIRMVYRDALPSMHCMDIPGPGGATIIAMLKKNCDKLNVNILTHCPATKLIVDEDGSVSGVVAGMKDKVIRVNAKSVIMASGGYGGNKELLKKYYPGFTETMVYEGGPLMGDGLEMAWKAGAAQEGLGLLMLHQHVYPGRRLINIFARKPYTIIVNKKGERFVDETLGGRSPECGNALERQPEKCVFVLLDESMKQDIIDEFKKGGSVIKLGGGIPVAKDLDLDKELEFEAAKGGLKIAGSWDEISEWIGASPAVLKSTVSEYNSFCTSGYDADFGKDNEYLRPYGKPPYYALRCYLSYMTTIGGIKINHRMEVLNNNDDIIPGFYAGGDCSGGWESDTYCMVLSGSGLGFALNSGRIAGENAADFAMAEK